MQDVPADFYEPPEFKGLLFYDGVDSIGRPVVVVDFDAVAPSTTRSAVMQYILQRLEPIVSQVEVVFRSLGNNGRLSIPMATFKAQSPCLVAQPCLIGGKLWQLSHYACSE